MKDVCEHGVRYEELCEPCSHYRAEEWAGYPIFICARCVVPWPCEYAQADALEALDRLDQEKRYA